MVPRRGIFARFKQTSSLILKLTDLATRHYLPVALTALLTKLDPINFPFSSKPAPRSENRAWQPRSGREI